MAWDGFQSSLPARCGEFSAHIARNGPRIGRDIDQAAAVFPVDPRGRAVGRMHAHGLAGCAARGPDLLERGPQYGVIRAERAAERVRQVARTDIDAVDVWQRQRPVEVGHRSLEIQP